MSQVWKFFTTVILLEFFFCHSVSIPLQNHDDSVDTAEELFVTSEIDAENICSSSHSISELQSLARSNHTCISKDTDLEFWVLSCRCAFETGLTCPICNEQPEERSVSRTSTPTVPSKLTPRPTQLTTDCINCHDNLNGSRSISVTVPTVTHPVFTTKWNQTTRHNMVTDSPSTRTPTPKMTNEVDTHTKLKLNNITPSSINFIRFG